MPNKKPQAPSQQNSKNSTKRSKASVGIKKSDSSKSGSSNSKKAPKKVIHPPNTLLKSVQVGDVFVKPGDDVIIRASKKEPDFIGKIFKIVSHPKCEAMVTLSWYYRPEDTESGKKAFYGEKELFSSDHYDQIELSTINGRCNVHTLKDYQKLDEVQDDDYFYRFSYMASTGKFKPDRVPVYCKCEMPYNPDEFMVFCEGCLEWYHTECLNINKKEVSKVAVFLCNDCKPQTSKNSNGNTKSSGQASCYRCHKFFTSDNVREECQGCHEWFHAPCMGYKKDEIANIRTFMCRGCKKDRIKN